MANKRTIGPLTGFVLRHVSLLVFVALIMIVAIFSFTVLQWTSISATKQELYEQRSFLKQELEVYEKISSKLPALKLDYQTEQKKAIETQNSLNSSLEQLKALEEKLVSLKKEHELIISENKKIKDENIALIKQNEELSGLSNQIIKAKSTIEEYKSEILNLEKKISDSKEESLKLSIENKKLASDTEAKLSEFNALKDKYDKVLADSSALEAKIVALDKEYKSLVDDKSNFSKLQKLYESKLEELAKNDQSLLDTVKALKQDRDNLGAEVIAFSNGKDGFFEKLKLNEESLLKQNQALEDIVKNYEEQFLKLENISKSQSNLSEMSSQLEGLLKTYAEQVDKLTKLNESLEKNTEDN